MVKKRAVSDSTTQDGLTRSAKYNESQKGFGDNSGTGLLNANFSTIVCHIKFGVPFSLIVGFEFAFFVDMLYSLTSLIEALVTHTYMVYVNRLSPEAIGAWAVVGVITAQILFSGSGAVGLIQRRRTRENNFLLVALFVMYIMSVIGIVHALLGRYILYYLYYKVFGVLLYDMEFQAF